VYENLLKLVCFDFSEAVMLSDNPKTTESAMYSLKTGYILSSLNDSLKISAKFFDACKARVNKSVRYLYPDIIKEAPVLNKEWRLYVPQNIVRFTGEEGSADA